MNVQTPTVPSVRIRWDLQGDRPDMSVRPDDRAHVAHKRSAFTAGQRAAEPAAVVGRPILSKRARTVLARRLLRKQRKHETAVNLAADSLTEDRAVRLAANCSRHDLLLLHGCGPAVADEIEAWLTVQGGCLRPGPTSPRAALHQAINHIEAMLDGSDANAFLTAYLALPELRRSLAT